MAETVHNRPSRVIRTCHRDHPGDAARHQWLIDEDVKHFSSKFSDLDNSAPGLGASGRAPEFLNDASRYDFGSDYQKIFSVCPDTLHHGQGTWNPVSPRQRLTDLVDEYRYGGQYDDPDHVLRAASTWLVDASMMNWVQVEDEAFLAGEPVLLVYDDQCGRTCYSQRLGPRAGEETGNGHTPALQHGG